ncbi:MAG: hypothetical protein RL434_2586 [Pseudomonadota bacterium]|jgi:hypothetical protein
MRDVVHSPADASLAACALRGSRRCLQSVCLCGAGRLELVDGFSKLAPACRHRVHPGPSVDGLICCTSIPACQGVGPAVAALAEGLLPRPTGRYRTDTNTAASHLRGHGACHRLQLEPTMSLTTMLLIVLVLTLIGVSPHDLTAVHGATGPVARWASSWWSR